METAEIRYISGQRDQLELKLPDGASITTAAAVLARSPVLHGALHAEENGSRSTLAAPTSYLSAWIRHIAAERTQHCGNGTSASLLVTLKAADFFADDEAATELTSQVGALLLEVSGAKSRHIDQQAAKHTAATQWCSDPDSPVHHGGMCQATCRKVLQELPDHLLMSVVQAADFSLLQSLTLLPASHHHLALCALFPDITRHHSLRLTEPLMASQRPAALLTQDACAKLDVRILRPLFKALHRLRSLRELHIWTHERTAVPDSDVRGFHTALMQLPELTSLTLEGGLVPVAINELSEALGCCLKLQSVSLRMFRPARPLMPPLDTTGRPHVKLSSLFEALKKCTRLESLSLKGLNTGACVPAGEWAGCVSMAAALSRLSSLTLAQACINADQLACVVQELPQNMLHDTNKKVAGMMYQIFRHDSADISPQNQWWPKLLPPAHGDPGNAGVWQRVSLSHLLKLDLGGNGRELGEGAANIKTLLQALPNLQHLMLEKNMMMATGAQHLAPAFTTLTNLSHLDMSDNTLGPGLKELAEAWASLQRLKSLTVETSFVPCATASALSGLIAKFSALTKLHWRKCALVDSACTVALAASLRSFSTLKSLRLGVRSDVGGVFSILAPSISHHSGLSEVILSSPGSGLEEGMTPIMHCIGQLPELQRLDLMGPGVTRAGAEVLGSCLCSLTKLQELKLQFRIPKTVSAAVCAALSQLVHLTSLSLALCALTPDAVSAVAGSLACMHSLRSLGLPLNMIGDGAAQVVARAVRSHPALRCVDLSGTRISHAAADAVVGAADAQGVVETVLLQGNQLQSGCMAKPQRRISVVLGNSDPAAV